MDKVRRFTKSAATRRSFSSSTLKTPKSNRGRPHSSQGERIRSLSEILTPAKVPRISEHLLHYLGYAWVDEPRSTKELQAGIRFVHASNLVQKSVSVTYFDGNLNVSEMSGDKVLVSPLHFIAQVVPDDMKGSSCLAISFMSGHNNNQCHVFQAKTNREAADIVQAIHKVYRSASKGVSKKESSSSLYGIPKNLGSDLKKIVPRVNMEDEDELLEFKKTPGPAPGPAPVPAPVPLNRIQTKKSVVRLSSEIISSSSSMANSSPRASSTSESFSSRNSRPTPSPMKDSRRWAGRRGINRHSDREFTREDKVSQLSNAVEKIKENNSSLRDKCNKIQNPTSPFEDALYAMQMDNLDLLKNYLSCGHVIEDAADVSGNTLLHYAVAMGRIEIIRIVCKSSMASPEAPGWNECRPIHRAAAEGNIPVMKLLLKKGVNVNGMDIMRRTPLHITSDKMELVECSIALLEFGAQTTATDVLGLRPCDVNPDLKEIQNRLINSACESFVTSQVRDSGLVSSSSSATPHSFSPGSSRPSSITSAGSHDLWQPSAIDPITDLELSKHLDTVIVRAKAISKAYANKTKFRRSMNQMLTRSLSELQEAEEDEMYRKDRLEKLKFPSEFNLYSNSYEVERDALNVMDVVNKLTNRARRLVNPNKRTSFDNESGVSEGFHMATSLSEPNLLALTESSVISKTDETPRDVPRPFSSTAVLQGNKYHQELYETHQTSSTGTLVSNHTNSNLDQVERAFEELEEELCEQGTHMTKESQLHDSTRLSHSPLFVQRRSKEETIAILDSIISDINTFSDELDSPLPSPKTPHTPLTMTPTTEAKVTEGLKESRLSTVSPKSAESPGTLKKFKFTSGTKRRGSPLLRGKMKTTSAKGEDKKEVKLRQKREADVKRKISLPEMNRMNTKGLDEVHSERNTSQSPSLEAVYNQFPSPRDVNTSQALQLKEQFNPCEPVNTALKLMVTLSSNKECTATLISYICLPKCEAKLLSLAKDRTTPADMLTDIAALVQNIFEAGGGGEGKKISALSSGVLDLTIKLLNGRDPIPGTCLSLLNSLLVSEDDTDYLRTIIRIPSGPLLLYLEPCEPNESDSDQTRHDTTVSVGTRSSSDSGMGLSGMGQGILRGSSFGSEVSVSSSGRSVASPTLQGPSVTYLEAKRIVLKMFAVASSHHKMQKQLSNDRAINLLANCLSDPSLENVTNAIITLANVAQHTDSHKLLVSMGLVDKFCSLLSNGPRPRYHAARALVYLGKLDLLEDFSLFEPTATGYETDVVVTTTDLNGHVYARGATIEKCVEFITSNDISQLWGGFQLSDGLQSPTRDQTFTPKASKEQIITFFLTTYQSFVRPIIFMRLLLHRIGVPKHPRNPFNWCVPSDAVTLPSSQSTTGYTIPNTQMVVLNLIGRWLESFPDDFVDYSELQTEVSHVIRRLRLTRGPFIPHTHRLRSLMQDLSRPRNERHGEMEEDHTRVPHHDNLYQLCKQMVIDGHLPVTLDEAIFVAALQLHVEDLADPFSHLAPPTINTLTKNKKGFSLRLKSTLPPSYCKVKNISKRVKAQMEEFESSSERNSKHLYIGRCQSNPGYDCSFFSVKVPSGSRFKKNGIQKQLLGINSKRVIFLDEKSKELLSNYSLQSVLTVSRESDPCQLVLHLQGDPLGCKLQVESPSTAREIANVLEQCREGEGMVDESNLHWSDSIPSLFTLSAGPGELEESISTPTSNANSLEMDGTHSDLFLPHDPLRNGHSPFEAPLSLPNGGLQGSLQTHKSDTLRAFSRDDSMLTDVTQTDNALVVEEQTPFCDCPPDPELPLELDLEHLNLTEVLSCPLEVARQMTLISHQRFCALTPAELLQKVNLIPKPLSQQATPSNGTDSQQSRNIKKLAYRFNQVGNWVAYSILQYEYVAERAEVIQQFIKIAMHCLELRNTSSMMAIIVAGLGSAPIRRLHTTWDLIPKSAMQLFKQMDSILEERNNYKHYREKLSVTMIPAVPYVGVFLKDLTFICDGNPDYLRGGLINLHKRRQVYKTLEDIHHFQQDHYKLHQVPELQQYLLNHRLIAEDDIHSLSHTVEPRLTRSTSNHSNRSFSSSQKSFFKHSKHSSSSTGNLNRT